ncbi:3-(3-hydroxy-phenyl)propionate hydroxylase [Rhodovulum bhavnagarense]|uniref:3-(3-hydroxy-phenyl)propionate hydroxylase n=1 Tax=Rhodovulum bhavnagarense TaxID=992286 RepID=A0A4R2RHN9_9RHOB|nr:FAD-dependent monooxygenase [Rhodovulum bhavnagarense]TCP58695.1 3-(3-hydroxy-phenyl)propionate hydroxylase [Rhodovulum bhavnagarense]
MPHEYKSFAYNPPPGLRTPEPRHGVVIVGAGPVGLAMALDLAHRGIASVLLDEGDRVATGSRAICWSRRSLEILDRLGVADKVLDIGTPWQVGRTCYGDQEVFTEDFGRDPGDRMPPFVNIQQYFIEEFLVDAVLDHPLIDLRFKNRVIDVEAGTEAATLSIKTPDGPYMLEADYLLACDGARSTVRATMDLEFEGEMFEERFLVADIEMEADFPPERWFWFDPSFHDGQSALLHRQAGNVYRLDLHLGRDANAKQEVRPEKVIPRIEQVVGPDFELDWVSVYTFQCRRLARFVHGRVIFLGDAAHVVAPFGSRGGNGGLRDVDNLGWKLAAVLQGRAPETLLESYDRERVQSADENLTQAIRATRFMTPRPGVEQLFRDQVLALAGKAEFARPWVNPGRFSQPTVYRTDAPDDRLLPALSRPGAVAPDAPQGSGWLMQALGAEARLVAFNCDPPAGLEVPKLRAEVNETVRRRYLGRADRALYLIRPDQVVAARWVAAEPKAVSAALRALWEGRE